MRRKRTERRFPNAMAEQFWAMQTNIVIDQYPDNSQGFTTMVANQCEQETPLIMSPLYYDYRAALITPPCFFKVSHCSESVEWG